MRDAVTAEEVVVGVDAAATGADAAAEEAAAATGADAAAIASCSDEIAC